MKSLTGGGPNWIWSSKCSPLHDEIIDMRRIENVIGSGPPDDRDCEYGTGPPGVHLFTMKSLTGMRIATVNRIWSFMCSSLHDEIIDGRRIGIVNRIRPPGISLFTMKSMTGGRLRL
ncbi:hypothetical protein V6N13_073469 [Hibiscus sabdariffa]|uniref:Uncharacterized protein n=1 Tax=Hibiscus sabdariffa TaxID=183260 RepID=A0ABR1ZUR8_9ROSI